ncbi:MAG: PAS domain-containing protein [Spirochaetales bacterium]|nr:PAS domain-containing protein [Spirochaetales bacterium]MCF7937315.1 PAS domain-containing protein [Spirochaetales bacterium]
MRKFIQKALNRIDRIDHHQLRSLFLDLADENELLEMVLDSMIDGVMVADTEHRLILMNKQIERFLPLHDPDWYEKQIWTVIEDEDVAEFVRDNLQDQISVRDKVFTIESGSKKRILSCSIVPLVLEGGIEGNLLHVIEITDQREREARLRRAENLASLTTLAAGVAHEIKNPLGSMGIHIQLIQKLANQLEEEKKTKLTEYLGVLEEEVERLNKIVVDFLFAVRPMNVEPEPTNLNSLMDDLADFMHYELEQKGVAIERDFSSDLPELQLDEKYIKQAVLNIIKNALYAMEDGGVLTISTKNEGNDVVLSIRDTGHGMDEETMEKIFEPYFTTRDFGSGLGLTLTYKIIKEHMGEIQVESKPGKGTVFSLIFPVPEGKRRLLDWKGEQDEFSDSDR